MHSLYGDRPFSERSRLMLRAAELLETEKHELGRMMTLEMGKPIRAAVQEAEKCARACRFYAEHAEEFLADRPAQTDATHSYVAYQPLGPVLAIMPWNFPFWQVFRFAAPALMAGNVALLKHASNVPQCALAIEGIFRRARAGVSDRHLRLSSCECDCNLRVGVESQTYASRLGSITDDFTVPQPLTREHNSGK